MNNPGYKMSASLPCLKGPPDHDDSDEQKHRDQGSFQKHLGEFAGQSRSNLASYQDCQDHHQDQVPRQSKVTLEEKVGMGQRRSQNGQGDHKDTRCSAEM